MQQHIKRKRVHSFNAAAAQVIVPVANFGEDFCAHLFRGKVVSQEEEFATFADVFVKEQNLAIQVKMCNHRHAHRPTVEQVETLYNEAGSVGFVTQVDHGIYALVFYNGVHPPTKTRRGKSKLLSRRLDVTAKRQIIARELQYVYVIDVRLMQFLATNRDFTFLRKSGGVKVWNQRKVSLNHNRPILYLTRTFLGRFLGKAPDAECRKALDTVYNKTGWMVKEECIPMRFTRNKNVTLTRDVSVRIIGSRALVRKVGSLIEKRRRPPMQLSNELTLNM